MQDIRRFHQGFYSSTDKIEQDCFILRYAMYSMSIEYFISSFRKEKGSIPLKVCQNTFLGILKLSQYRVQNLCRRELQTDETPKERRDVARHQEHFQRRTQAVKEFIERIQPLENLIFVERLKDLFLNSDLSIRKLCETYNKEQTDTEMLVTYDFLRKIFVNNYNISFKSPATDQDLKCIELKERVKNTRNVQEKINLQIIVKY